MLPLFTLLLAILCWQPATARLCAVGCTPNCNDGVSQCDPSYQLCLNDHAGGCQPYDLTTTKWDHVTSVVKGTTKVFPVSNYEDFVTQVSRARVDLRSLSITLNYLT